MSLGIVQQLESAVMALPPAERARLAQRLIESLDEESEVEEAWAAEIKKRLEALDRGEIDLIPAEEVIAEARRHLEG